MKSLVERMGGSVQVTSVPVRGSLFEVWLQPVVSAVSRATLGHGAAPQAPPARPGEASRDGSAPASAPAPARRTLLYVEDNAVNALIIRELLNSRPVLALHIAVDGASGVAQALALQPDLILLDMQLPDCSGFEVLRRLRAQPATAHTPCVALSANTMPDHIQRALAAGMADYWTKPLDFRAFLTALDKLLEQPA